MRLARWTTLWGGLEQGAARRARARRWRRLIEDGTLDVIEWQAVRLRPSLERVAWGGPALVTQAAALMAVWVIAPTPGVPEDFDRVEGYVALTSMGLLLAAAVWWSRWLEIREARRRRPRRVAVVSDHSA